VTSVQDQTGASMDALKDALIHGFQRNRNVELGGYSVIEQQRAQELVQERFNNDSWTFRL
jgi:lipoate-protein ligase A